MNSLCSHERLELALAGSLNADDEAALHLHLEECESCFAEMARLSGGEQASREVAAMLIPDDFYDAAPLREECSTADFVVDHLEPSDDPAVLGRLGGYDVLDIIGRGGMGVVLKGFDRELKRFVAIKALAPHLAHSALARKRFAREAQAAAAVVNLHVIAIHQVQPNGQLPFLVMPLLTGESLAQRLKARGTLELKEILRIGMQAAEGLAAAHGQGLIHRDVKPANILLEKGVERAVLTDFGLARAADDVSMTRWGIIAGTPEYMSPEQARGEALDGRSDLFSLGCVLYEMATGVSPFRTDSTMATLRRIVDEQPAAMASLVPELPPWFCHIVERLLSKDPAQRFTSASEVSQLLEQCLSHLQQPTSVPLPNSLVPHAAGRRSFFKLTRKGVFAMLGSIGMTLLGMVLLQATEAPDISGQWASDEWGTVVLDAKGPGKFAGTFSGTGKGQPPTGHAIPAGSPFGIGGAAGEGDASPGKLESGTLQLKWSRVERRYNGTWGTGDDRSGKMSLRLVDNEIRGAWTANKIAQKESASPRLADLLWIRSQNAASEVAKAPTLAMPERPETFLDRLQGTWRTSGEPMFVWEVFTTGINETVFDATGNVSSEEWLIRDEGNLDDLVSPARIELMAKDRKTGGFSGFTNQKCLLAVDGDSLVCCKSSTGDFPNEIAKRPDLWVREFRRDKETPLELLGDWIVDDWVRGSGDDTVLKSNDIDFPMYALRFHSDRFWLRALDDKHVESPDQRMIGFRDVRQFQWSFPGESKPGEFLLTVQSNNRTQLLYGRFQSMRTRPQAKPDRLRLTISRRPLTGDSPSASDWHFECHRATTGALDKLLNDNSGSAKGSETENTARTTDLDRKNARSVVEAYVSAALAGKVEQAASLANGNPAVRNQIESLSSQLNVQRLVMKSVYVNDPTKPTTALATSEAVKLLRKQPDGQRDGFLVLTLTMSEKGWLVSDIDFESEEGAEDELKRFLEANPKSIDLPPLTPNSLPQQNPAFGKAEDKDILAAEKAFQQLQSTKDNADKTYSKALSNAKNDIELERAYDELDPRQTLTSKYLAFEEKYRGTPAALKALTRVMSFARGVGDPTCAAAEGRIEAVDRLMNHYLRHDGIEKTFDALNGGPEVPRHNELLQAVLESSSSRHVQTAALVAQLEWIRNTLNTLTSLPAFAEHVAEYPEPMRAALQSQLRRLENIDSEQLRAKANDKIKRLKEYQQETVAVYGTASGAAKHLSHAINRVIVGKPAPEITATTTTGKLFRLSKLRGTTVVLIFADNQGADNDLMYAPLRKLAAEYEDGVEVVMILANHDDQKQSAVALKRHLPWTVIPQTFNGPVILDWGIEGVPTVYIIDSDGILHPQLPMTINDDSSGYDTQEVAAALDNLLNDKEGTAKGSETENTSDLRVPDANGIYWSDRNEDHWVAGMKVVKWPNALYPKMVVEFVLRNDSTEAREIDVDVKKGSIASLTITKGNEAAVDFKERDREKRKAEPGEVLTFKQGRRDISFAWQPSGDYTLRFDETGAFVLHDKPAQSEGRAVPFELSLRVPFEAFVENLPIRWSEPHGGLRLGAMFVGAKKDQAPRFRQGDQAAMQLFVQNLTKQEVTFTFEPHDVDGAWIVGITDRAGIKMEPASEALSVLKGEFTPSDLYVSKLAPGEIQPITGELPTFRDGRIIPGSTQHVDYACFNIRATKPTDFRGQAPLDYVLPVGRYSAAISVNLLKPETPDVKYSVECSGLEFEVVEGGDQRRKSISVSPNDPVMKLPDGSSIGVDFGEPLKLQATETTDRNGKRVLDIDLLKRGQTRVSRESRDPGTERTSGPPMPDANGIYWSDRNEEHWVTGMKVVQWPTAVNPKLVVEFLLRNDLPKPRDVDANVAGGNKTSLTLSERNKATVDIKEARREKLTAAANGILAFKEGRAEISFTGLESGEYALRFLSVIDLHLAEDGPRHGVPFYFTLPVKFDTSYASLPIHWGKPVAGLRLGAMFLDVTKNQAKRFHLRDHASAQLFVQNVSQQEVECGFDPPYHSGGWGTEIADNMGQRIGGAWKVENSLVGVLIPPSPLWARIAPNEVQPISGEFSMFRVRDDDYGGTTHYEHAKFTIVAEKPDELRALPPYDYVLPAGEYTARFSATLRKADSPDATFEVQSARIPFHVGDTQGTAKVSGAENTLPADKVKNNK